MYAIKNAKDISALKAVSQNLVHADLSITDGVYGILSSLDVKDEITHLGKNIQSGQSDEIRELKALINMLLLKLGEGKST